MSETDTISTETWRISLPADWAEKEPDAAPLYFESPDGSKGVYLSSWQFADDPRTIEQIAESFQAAERRTCAAMEGREWTFSETSSTEEDMYISTLDCFDEANCYRIIVRFLGSLPWVVRATFHDYCCRDYTVSAQSLAPIIRSLHLHHIPV